MSATLYIRYCHKYKNNMFIICPLSNPSLIILFARYMHFDVQKAIELLGEKYVNEAKQAALNSSSNLNMFSFAFAAPMPQSFLGLAKWKVQTPEHGMDRN